MEQLKKFFMDTWQVGAGGFVGFASGKLVQGGPAIESLIGGIAIGFILMIIYKLAVPEKKVVKKK